VEPCPETNLNQRRSTSERVTPVLAKR